MVNISNTLVSDLFQGKKLFWKEKKMTVGKLLATRHPYNFFFPLLVTAVKIFFPLELFDQNLGTLVCLSVRVCSRFLELGHRTDYIS